MNEGRAARNDLIASGVWAALGLVVLVLSWTMDRLGALQINPYTIPGLVPGLLGAGLIVLAALLARRAIARGALAAMPRRGWERAALLRLAGTAALCVCYALLLGHAPFWLATLLFVFAFVALFEFRERAERGQRARGFAVAAVCAIAVAAIVTSVFQELFLVRLP
jgi:hypothetical protein